MLKKAQVLLIPFKLVEELESGWFTSDGGIFTSSTHPGIALMKDDGVHHASGRKKATSLFEINHLYFVAKPINYDEQNGAPLEHGNVIMVQDAAGYKIGVYSHDDKENLHDLITEDGSRYPFKTTEYFLVVIATTNPELWTKKPIKNTDGHFLNEPVAKIDNDFSKQYVEQLAIRQVMLEWEGCEICDNTGYYAPEGVFTHSKCSRCMGVSNAYLQPKLRNNKTVHVFPAEAQLYSRDIWIDFICFYSGMERSKVERQVDKWFDEHHPIKF